MSFDFNQIEKQNSLDNMMLNYYDIIKDGMYNKYYQTDHRSHGLAAIMHGELQYYCGPKLLEVLYPDTITFMPYFVKDYVVTSPDSDNNPKLLYGECHNVTLNSIPYTLDELFESSNLIPESSLVHTEIFKAAIFSAHSSNPAKGIYFTPDDGIGIIYFVDGMVVSFFVFFTGLVNYRK